MTTEADMLRARQELEELNRLWRLEPEPPKDNRAALAVVGLGLLVFWGAVIWGLVR